MPSVPQSERTGPLAGCRIVEFDAIGPVPLAGMILSDLGADIARIERPQETPGRGLGNAVLLRGRKRIALDLKSPSDREKALALVARAEGLIEGARPGVMERLGLGPEECFARNPALAYGRMTGWGQGGSLASAAGHDINYIAITGALACMGSRDTPPIPPLNLVGDYGGGSMFLCVGMLAAILSARQTGTGQVVDAAMSDGASVLMSMFYAMRDAGHWSDEREANLIDGGAPFYRCYECADGKFVAVGALEPQFYAILLGKLSLDPERHPQHDRSGWPALSAILAERFRSKTRDEWTAVFAGTDACVTPVLSMAEAPAHPHNRQRSTFVEHQAIVQPMPAPRFSRTPPDIGKSRILEIEELLELWA